MILRNHVLAFFQFSNSLKFEWNDFLILFIWCKKIFFRFKYSTDKNLINYLFNFIIFEWRQFILQIKENISVSHITHVLMRLRRHSFSKLREKKQWRNFFKSRKLFFDRTAMYKFGWSKEIFFESKKLFSGYISVRSKQKLEIATDSTYT